jgi:hypothetical protein
LRQVQIPGQRSGGARKVLCRRDNHLRRRSGLGFDYKLFCRLRLNHVRLNRGRWEHRGLDHDRRGLGSRHVVDNDLHRRLGHGLVGDIDRPLGGLLLLAAPCFFFSASCLFFLCRPLSGRLLFGTLPGSSFFCLALGLGLLPCRFFGSLALGFYPGLLFCSLASLFGCTLPLKLLDLPACLFGGCLARSLFLGSTLGCLFLSLATCLSLSLAA